MYISYVIPCLYYTVYTFTTELGKVSILIHLVSLDIVTLQPNIR